MVKYEMLGLAAKYGLSYVKEGFCYYGFCMVVFCAIVQWLMEKESR